MEKKNLKTQKTILWRQEMDYGIMTILINRVLGGLSGLNKRTPMSLFNCFIRIFKTSLIVVTEITIQDQEGWIFYIKKIADNRMLVTAYYYNIGNMPVLYQGALSCYYDQWFPASFIDDNQASDIRYLSILDSFGPLLLDIAKRNGYWVDNPIFQEKSLPSSNRRTAKKVG